MTTVFIWNNNLMTNKLSPQRKHQVIGHAALSIDDQWDRGVGNDGNWTDNTASYVSYWPSGVASILGGVDSFFDKLTSNVVGMTRAKKAEKGRNFWSDLSIEGYAPDHIIRILHSRDAGSADRMRTSWTDTWNKPGGPNYRADVKNCSRLAARVLKAGFPKKLPWNTTIGHNVKGIWTPLMVKRLALHLAEKVGGRELTWSQFLDEQLNHDAISTEACAGFKLFMRRASNRGEGSGATARFQFDNGKFSEDRGKNPDVFDHQTLFVRREGKEAWTKDVSDYVLEHPATIEHLCKKAAKHNKDEQILGAGIWYRMRKPWKFLWGQKEGISIDLTDQVQAEWEELQPDSSESSSSSSTGSGND